MAAARRRPVTFPSWGRGARVQALLPDGSTVALGRSPLALSRVRSLHVKSERSGYRVLPLAGPPARCELVTTRPQPADPNPGPTVEITSRVAGPCPCGSWSTEMTRQLDARADVELGVDVAQVRLDRAGAEDELLGRFPVRAPGRDQVGDLALAGGQRTAAGRA